MFCDTNACTNDNDCVSNTCVNGACLSCSTTVMPYCD